MKAIHTGMKSYLFPQKTIIIIIHLDYKFWLGEAWNVIRENYKL